MYCIPDQDYAGRVKTFQANLKKAGLDAALVHGNEADCANVRYLSEYWPTFEAAAVFVPAEGEAVLLIGPESENYAKGRSKLPKIMKMVEYRESAEPQYPGIPVAKFQDVVKAAMPGKKLSKLGIVSWSITPLPVYLSLQEQLPGVELVKADASLLPMRFVKSANELALMRKAYQISELAVDAILAEIEPGMTEYQVVGIAQREIYKHGGEYEGHALYCFCGPATNNAISRPTYNKIVKNEVIQLSTSAPGWRATPPASGCRCPSARCPTARNAWSSSALRRMSRPWSSWPPASPPPPWSRSTSSSSRTAASPSTCSTAPATPSA